MLSGCVIAVRLACQTSAYCTTRPDSQFSVRCDRGYSCVALAALPRTARAKFVPCATDPLAKNWANHC